MPASITACGLIQATLAVQGDGTARAEQTWRIQTSEATGVLFVEGNANAFNANFPIRGSAFWDGYSTNSFLQATSVVVDYQDSENSRSLFMAKATFVTPGGPDAPQITRDPTVSPTGDPLDEPPVIYFTVTKTKEAFLKDRLDKAVCSSAGEPYNPVQERDRTLYTLHIERNIATDESVLNETYKDSVNSGTFWGRAVDCAKMEIPGLVQRLYTPAGVKYFRETWEISFDDDSHQLTLHDWGYKKLDGAGDVVTIMGADGTYLTAPTFLDGSGIPLDPQPPTGTPFDLPEFRRYKRKDFDALSLPTSM
jgi:hypothetical protein